MNIYEKRLVLANQLLEFAKQTIKDKSKWQAYNLERNRDGPPQRLWCLREKLNMSYEDFARSIGLEEKEYKRYERIGEKVPDEVIKKVSEIYKIDKAWIEQKLNTT